MREGAREAGAIACPCGPDCVGVARRQEPHVVVGAGFRAVVRTEARADLVPGGAMALHRRKALAGGRWRGLDAGEVVPWHAAPCIGFERPMCGEQRAGVRLWQITYHCRPGVAEQCACFGHAQALPWAVRVEGARQRRRCRARSGEGAWFAGFDPHAPQSVGARSSCVMNKLRIGAGSRPGGLSRLAGDIGHRPVPFGAHLVIMERRSDTPADSVASRRWAISISSC